MTTSPEELARHWHGRAVFPGAWSHYIVLRTLPDGRLIGVARLLFHWTIHVDIDEIGYADRYCFATEALARAALDAWDGRGDPIGWHRRPSSGRRRDIASGREWIDP